MSKKETTKRDYAPLEASVVGDEILIRLPIENLPMAVKIACDMGTLVGPIEIADANVFAKDICDALNDEDEEGTTPLMLVFDQAMERAVECGSLGVLCEDDT